MSAIKGSKGTGRVHRVFEPMNHLGCVKSENCQPNDQRNDNDRRQQPFLSDFEEVPDSLSKSHAHPLAATRIALVRKRMENGSCSQLQFSNSPLKGLASRRVVE